jgi:uncharacterized protein YeaO (DUF488 family)
MINVKRVYLPPEQTDGRRFLVDRLWPRGIKKDKLHCEAWFKEAAPSDSLRVWYQHDPDKWEEFKLRYFAELDGKPEVWKPMLDAARKGDITLLYSTRNETNNNALALKAYLDGKL